jgi:glycogen debranching enzyme
MKIKHKTPGAVVDKECDSSLCILSNSIGSFLFLSEQPISKYSGLLLNEDLQIYKTLENLWLVDSSIEGIENNLGHVKRKHKANTEKISFPRGVNGIVYTLAKKAWIGLDFDCRRVDDLKTFGRMYEVVIDKGIIIIRFTKKTNENEDTTHDEEEYRVFLAIKPGKFDRKRDYRFIDQWKEIHYPFDQARKDSPTTRYVYSPFIVNAKELLIGMGRTEDEALSELETLQKQKPVKHNFLTIDGKKNPSAAAAFVCAQDSLEKLKLEHQGIIRLYAGYPWFFQMWSRDENISLGGLLRTKQYSIVKDVLFCYLKGISKDGRLPNRLPFSHLKSADGVGWFWKRVGDLLSELKKNILLEKYISDKELGELNSTLKRSIDRIEKAYMKDGLITSATNETWMDTQWRGEDGRPGAAIEVQALHLNMLRLMQEISDDKDKKKYKTKETEMKKNVLEAFWNKKFLADTAGNYLARPNIFIAYYVYPDLLSRKDWQTCFRNILKKTWLDWGGLSSIDTSHHLFTSEYTGKDNQSYHRGDSWYWVNNLAALCLFRNNPIEFDTEIQKIIHASSEEILWHGALGHHAELGSASHISSRGCLAQAWSNSMFIELITEVNKIE